MQYAYWQSKIVEFAKRETYEYARTHTRAHIQMYTQGHAHTEQQ